MTQIMGNKWDNLPNEVLAHIIEALGSAKNLNKEANKNLQRWAPVNKQWYDRFPSLKYKEITITLNNSDVLLQNIIQSSFLPGRWVKSITIEALCTMYNTSVPLGSDDPLNLLMTRCLNVKNVTLPQYMDDRSVGIYWRYFSNALVNNNTWKLQSLAVGNLTRPITFDSAKTEYFDCVHHLRSSIRQLVLTTGMVPSGCFRCLQEFQQLATLAIRERLIGNLTDLCGLMIIYLNNWKILQHTFPPTIENDSWIDEDSSTNSNDSTIISQEQERWHSTINATANSVKNYYPNIRSMYLHEYFFRFPLEQSNDILLLKRFDELDYLNISISKSTDANNLVDNVLIDYICTVIPSYQISMYVGKDNGENLYLDLHRNRILKMRDDAHSSNNQDFHLRISLFSEEDVVEVKDSNHNKIVFTKNSKRRITSSAVTIDGEIFCYI